MTVTLEEFIESLSDTGLMSADEARIFLHSLPADRKPNDAAGFARELVCGEKLTSFQARAVYQGKGRGLAVGDYLILDKLGRGGMGHVYKAKHKHMKWIVALKVLPSGFSKSQFRRFRREAEAAARLIHPNIVTAYAADKAGGVHYFVMEYVEGSDLSAVVKTRGPLSVTEAVNYVCQAARALAHAHSQKIIHRDVKPQNLLLDREGAVKVLDMGLARFEQRTGPDDSTYAATVTQNGTILGTIDYMPPEQVTDPKSVDHRADIYSLGCTLFYLLTGRAVYGGEELIQRIMAHREAPIPSLSAARSDVPEALDAVFRRMVAKQPEERYQSMSEVITALQASVAAGGGGGYARMPYPTIATRRPDYASGFHQQGPGRSESLIQPELEPLDDLTEQWLKAELPEPCVRITRLARSRAKRARYLLIGLALAVVAIVLLLIYLLI